MSRYAYFGDLKLHSELRTMVPTWTRGVVQTFNGVDRTRNLVVSNSPNYGLKLDVLCFFAPESALTKKGFRARELAVMNALIDRSETAAPVVWVDDSTKSKTVTSITGSTITSNSHGFVNGDRVLIRRSGVGLWTVSTVASASANAFDITANHTIMAADDILLCEQVYYGMTFDGMTPTKPSNNGDFYAEEVGYGFIGNGTSTYSRTAVS